MEALKYKVIKTESQYKQYCEILEKLVSKGGVNPKQDEIDLLTVLIEVWDREHDSFNQVDPIALLISLMAEHQMKQRDLMHVLELSKGNISEILHYKKGLSKEVIRKLSEYFKMSQEAFNRPYQLKAPVKARTKQPGSKSQVKHHTID